VPLGHKAEAALKSLDRLLERVVIERLQQAAVIAYEVVMVVVAALLHRGAFKARDAVTDVHARDQVEVLEHVDAAVDAGDADRPVGHAALQPRGQMLTDLLHRECAVLLREELDQDLACAAAPMPGAANGSLGQFDPRPLLLSELAIRARCSPGGYLRARFRPAWRGQATLVCLARLVHTPSLFKFRLCLCRLFHLDKDIPINGEMIMRIRIIIDMLILMTPHLSLRNRRVLVAAAVVLVLTGGGRALVSANAAVRPHSSSSAKTTTTASGGRIVAVGAENQYANVISQIGGKYVTATAIMSNPNTDPHTFEASPSVAQAVSAARLVVQNGVGYDTFMNKIEAASPSSSRKVIDVQTLLGLPDSTRNPHLWYSPATMPKVAAALAKDLSALAPSHAAYFAANAKHFDASLAPWVNALGEFKHQHPNTPVATTEPVGDYMLVAAGTKNRTPWDLQADIMNGVDPAPQAISIQNALFSDHGVKAFIYNQQVTDTLTETFLNEAAKNHIPVVGVYETMPIGYTYQSWMLAELDALKRAVTTGKSTTRL
jgi:zinc/manganese transport system substrate-binding protein